MFGRRTGMDSIELTAVLVVLHLKELIESWKMPKFPRRAIPGKVMLAMLLLPQFVPLKVIRCISTIL